MAAEKVISLLRFGQCLPCGIKNAIKVRVTTQKFHDYFLTHYPVQETYIVHDPEKICKPGDFVSIKEVPGKITTQITHKLVDVVYRFGDTIDPVTGKEVAGVHYREDIARRIELCGGQRASYKYGDAPPRGWQENKKDYSHREAYRMFDPKRVDKEHEIGVFIH